MRVPLVGPTYSTRSIMGDGERTINLFPETVESGLGKNKVILYGTPGLTGAITLGSGVSPVLGLYASSDGQLWAVSGGTLYSINAAGSPSSRGTVGGNSSSIINLSDNTNTLLVSVDGILYNCTLTGSDSASLATVPFTALSHLCFSDGYSIGFEPATNKGWISALYDSTSWDPLDFTTSDSESGNIKALIADHREIWIQKDLSTEVWGNTGNADFPYQRISGAFIEKGIASPRTLLKLDNCIYFVGRDKDGEGMVWMTQGYTPQRISNFAIEYMLQQSKDLSKVIAFSYALEGHTFYCIYDPSLTTTLCYDVASNMWHERARWNTATALYEPHRAVSHAYAYGKHWIGDRLTGTVYQLSMDVYKDDTEYIRRLRRTPHIYADYDWVYYKEFLMDIESGMGLATGQGSDPKIMVRYSDDGGKSFKNERMISMGKQGEYTRRVHLHKLGRARDRVFEVVITDPIPVRLVEGYIDADQGMK